MSLYFLETEEKEIILLKLDEIDLLEGGAYR